MQAQMKVFLAAAGLLQVLDSLALAQTVTSGQDFTCTVTSNGHTFTSARIGGGAYAADSVAPVDPNSGQAIDCTCGGSNKANCRWFRSYYNTNGDEGYFYGQCVQFTRSGKTAYGCCDKGYFYFEQGGTHNLLRCN